jgi:HEAT repeat protein
MQGGRLVADERQQHRDLENALKGLVKLVKALRYYPPSHPSLRAAAEEARQGFAPLLGSEPLSFVIRKEGFLLHDTPVAPDNPLLQKLAPFLFSRRIHRLTVLPDLSSRDLRGFARCLVLEPAAIVKLGGIQQALQKAMVSTIWVNEIDLEAILARKEELDTHKKTHPGGEEETVEELLAAAGQAGPEAGKPGLDAASREERDLYRVLQELQRPGSSQRYRQLLEELVPLIPPNLTEAGRPLVLRAVALLCRNATDRRLAEELRLVSRQALDRLTAEDLLGFLVASVCARSLNKEMRELLVRIHSFLGEKVTRRLMDRLAEVGDAQARRFLAEALIRQGMSAVPVLLQHLEDERWYVVRNAVGILGEIRAREAVPRFLPLLRHEETRVRREALRALTRIGGPEAVGILLRMAEQGDPELRPQALLSLGAMKDPSAVPTLLRLASQPDPWVKRAEEKKETIRALGEIGSPEAVPTLVAILGHRQLWRRARHNEIRAAAARALGEIGSPTAAASLEAAVNDRSPEVARAAAGALKQLRKGKEHGSGAP